MSFLRSSGLKAIMIMVFFLCWIITAIASGVSVLKKIQVNYNDESKHVLLEFDRVFSGEPLINFESGSISLRFDSVRTSPTLPSLIDSNSHSIIKAVRAVQVPEMDVVNLEILLKSSGYKTEFPVITRSGNKVYLGLNAKLTSLPPLSSSVNLTREAEERVNSDHSLSSNFSLHPTDGSPLESVGDFLPVASEDWTVTMLTLVLSLLFVLLLIYMIAYLYNRFFSGRFPSIQGAIRIKQLSSFHVGPKQKVIILEMNNRKFACGVTQTSINLITELEDETDQSFLHEINVDGKDEGIIIDQARAEFFKTRESESKKVDSETDKYFEEDGNHKLDFENLDQANDIFLKPNSEQVNTIDNTKRKNNLRSTEIRRPFGKDREKLENLTYGSQKVQDFAKKLSERLKILKPIK